MYITRQILKEVLSTLVLEDGKTYEQYREDYRLHFSVLATSRLERMAIWFRETDEKFKALLKEYSHLSVAEQDAFSKKCEISFRNSLQSWKVLDAHYMKEFVRLKTTLEVDKGIKSIDLLEDTKTELKELEQDINNHVNLAKKYVEDWGNQIAKAKLNISGEVIRQIHLLGRVTVENTFEDYLREFKRTNKPD